MKTVAISFFVSSFLRSTSTNAAFVSSRFALTFSSALARTPLLQRSTTFSKASRAFSTFLLAPGKPIATSPPNAFFSAMASSKLSGSDGPITMPFSDEIINKDTYNGITLYAEELDPNHTMDPATFANALQNALTIWRAEGKKGIWIHVPTFLSNLIPCCIEVGFDFHVVKREHCVTAENPETDTDRSSTIPSQTQNKGGSLVLSQWLPDSPSRLPFGPTHQVGIGALVLHPSDPMKMLVVQEKTGPAAAKKLWKMPTGLADPGEDVADAAVRELQEETGLPGNFEGIVCFRQAHPTSNHRKSSNAASASDLFFVCLLQLPRGSSPDLHKAQEEEIADIAWMSIEEYSAQGLWQGSPLYEEINRIMMKTAENSKDHESPPGAFVEAKLPVGFRPGKNSLYMSRM